MSNETYNSYLDAEGLALVLSGIRDKINAAAEGITNTKGKANGIATLDAGGNVPLSQLGNLDTTFFEVVTELPTDIRNIKKHIYILKGNKDGDNNKYAEYIYTGDLTDAGDLAGDVDATKWEKLGDFVPTFDLQEYVKKAGAVAKLKFYDPVWNDAWDGDDDQPSETAIRIGFADGSHQYLVVPKAQAPTNTSRSNSELSDSEKSKPFISPGSAGFMSPSDKGKLDKIDLNALTASINAANTAADNTNKAIKAAETATAGAEKVNATLTEENVFEVTGRTGVKKTLDMSGLVSAQSDVARIQESMGAYSDRPDITLVAKETNKAISADGVKVTKAGWAIAEFTAEKGNIYLFKPNEVDGDVCIFAEEITNIETRGIDYTYTYNADGTIETARATYLGATHIYTFSYAEDKSYTITDEAGETVEALPMTYETKVGSYSPLVRLNADAELPIDGYCRYMSHFKGNSSIKIVVSYKIDAADLVMKVVRDGVFASISTQLGNLSQKEDETRKKIEELHGSYVDVLFCEQATIRVDNSSIKVEPYRIYRLYPKKYLNFEQGWNTYCPLVWIDMTHWDSSKVENVERMFNNTTSLNEIDLTGINLSKVKNFNNMFRNSGIKRIKGLESLRIDSAVFLDNGTKDYYNAMFSVCKNLTDDSFGNLAAWDTSKMKYISLFKGCENITELHGIENWDTSSVVSLAGFFYNSKLKKAPNLSKWNTENVTNLDSFLAGNSFTDIDLSSWNVSNVTSIKSFLARTSSLQNVNLLGWNLCKVKDLSILDWSTNIKTLKLGEGFFSSPYITKVSFNLLEKWTDDSVKLSLVTNLYDRKANGLPDLTLTLHANTKKVLSEDDMAAITAKGYIIA